MKDTFVVAALYQFTPLPHYQELQEPLLGLCRELEIRGTLLLADEGINGTIAGSREAIDQILAYLKEIPEFKDLEHKESYNEKQPFHRMKVRLKKEIVSMGVPKIDPLKAVGTYVEPKDWNELISDPEVVLVDTRNDYEIEMGKFKGAVDPKTESFRQFPEYVDKQLNPDKDKKVAMYCTGGIRCEKATSLLKEQGFEEVYHLKGGILKYLEEIPQEDSLWEGECFVFDDRVAVNHDLDTGSWVLCYGCQSPISEEDRKSEHYIPGIQCARCYDKITPEKRASLEERQKQVRLARKRGHEHIGEHPPGRAYRAQ